MGRLIDEQDAIDALKAAYWDKNIQSAKDDPCIVDAMTDWAIRKIKMLPSAQPEIIRCKDCKYGVDYYHEGDCYCSNPKWGLKYFGGSWEFYCADAERRKE